MNYSPGQLERGQETCGSAFDDSSLPGTAGLPPCISSSTNDPDLQGDLLMSTHLTVSPRKRPCSQT